MHDEIIKKTGARLNMRGILYCEILLVTHITRPCWQSLRWHAALRVTAATDSTNIDINNQHWQSGHEHVSIHYSLCVLQ